MQRQRRKNVARVLRATFAVLAQLGVPDNVRTFLFALVAVSNGELKFEASDLDIGREAFSDKRGANTLKLWSKRARKALDRWQERTGFRCATIAAGGKVGDEYLPTLYELPLLDVIASVVDTGGDARAAAFAHLKELQDEHRRSKIERFDNRPRTEGKAMAKRCREAALTYAEQMCVEELNALPMHTPRAEALAQVEHVAEEFAGRMLELLRELLHTGLTRKERAENTAPPKTELTLAPKSEVVDSPADAAEGVSRIRLYPPRANSTDLTTLPSEEKKEVKEVTGAASVTPPVSSSAGFGESESARAIALFESVGASRFEVTMRDEAAARSALHRKHDAAELCARLPFYLKRNETRAESFIIRPRGASLIQVDDLSAELHARFEPFAFLTLCTSPDSYQAWLALPSGTSEETRADVRARLLRQFNLTKPEADKGASGALRVPGSLNRKPKHEAAPPRVHLVQACAGRFVTPAELERARLLAPPEPSAEQTRGAPVRSEAQMPRYATKYKASGDVDRSRSDFDFALRALRCGCAQSDVEARLLELSAKAQARRRTSYVRRTVERAAFIIATTPERN
jgi:hypothetical protein